MENSMASLSTLLAAKIQDKGLNFTAAANALDVSSPSLRAVLAGRSVPNKRSVGKYAKFLDLSEDEVMAVAGTRGGKGKKGKGGKGKAKGKPGRRGRPAGKDKPKGKPGRPKLPGVAKATIRLLTTSITSVQKRIDRMRRVIEKIS
jgi:hypothetical protein